MNNEELFRRYLENQDEAAFTAIYRANWDRLWYFACIFVEGHLAEDLVIEAFFRLAQCQQAPPKVLAWLIRVLRNLCIDQIRKRNRNKECGLENREGEFRDPESPDPGPVDVLIGAEETERFQNCIDQMPINVRETVRLLMQGITRSEIASLLGVSPAAITHRLYRAIEIIRREFPHLNL